MWYSKVFAMQFGVWNFTCIVVTAIVKRNAERYSVFKFVKHSD